MNFIVMVYFIIFLIILIILSSTFSAAETAYSSISPAKLEDAIKKKFKWALLVKKHYKSFGWTLSTILISNNLVNVAISSITTFLISKNIEASETSTIIATFIATPIIVMFGEIVPKILARIYSLQYLKYVVYLIQFLNIFFSPLTFLISKLTFRSSVTNSEKDIINLLNLAQNEGVIEAGEATLAKKALKLDSTIVKDVMTPKNEIVSIKINSTIKKAKQKFIESGHSRLLVSKDLKYIGVLLLKDIIAIPDNKRINKYIIPLFSISKLILVTKALEEMRIRNVQIARVVMKKNSQLTVGLITIEDILEELVGEIYDEHDLIDQIREISHHKYIANGSTKMKNLQEFINFDFENVEDLTIKQWVQWRINRKIKKGLKYEYKDKIIFRVLKNKYNKETLIEIRVKIN